MYFMSFYVNCFNVCIIIVDSLIVFYRLLHLPSDYSWKLAKMAKLAMAKLAHLRKRLLMCMVPVTLNWLNK